MTDQATKFRDLSVGDTFDFVGPDRTLNSYLRRCVKLSARTYTPTEGEGEPRPLRVGTINCKVYHVRKLREGER